MSPMVKVPLRLEHALLGFLLREPMHAYDIHRALTKNSQLGLIWHLKQSQLYALLAKLEDEGFITGTTETQGTRPPRRMLHLTSTGRAAFQRWVVEPVSHGRDFRQEFLAKLFFAQHNDDATTVATLLANQRETCRALVDSLRAQSTEHPRDLFDLLVLQFRIGQLEHILSWLDLCDNVLSASALP